MTTRRMSGIQRGAVFALWVVLTLSGTTFAQDSRGGFEQRGLPHQHLDARYANNHYYFDRGYRVSAPPYTGVAIVHDGVHFWYDRGQWYRLDGAGWLVVAAPVGVFVSALPLFYTTEKHGSFEPPESCATKWSASASESR
jgi:hypothetical protein